MNTQAIVDYLRPLLQAGTDLPYADVRKARKLDPEIQDRNAELPLLLVHPWSEQGLQPQGLTHTRQGATVMLGCVTVCLEVDLERARDLLFQTLIGKKLPGYVYLTHFTRAEVIGLDQNVIWWRDIFQTQKDRRSMP